MKVIGRRAWGGWYLGTEDGMDELPETWPVNLRWDGDNYAWSYRVWRAAVVRLGLPGLWTHDDVDAAVKRGELRPGCHRDAIAPSDVRPLAAEAE